MKFAYTYKQSDGVRREGVEFAQSKEEVFERLRERGIKAIKVEPTGWLYVHRAVVRGVVLVVLLSVIGILSATLLVDRRSEGKATQNGRDEGAQVAKRVDPRIVKPRPRKQIEGFEEIDLNRVFAHPSERYLARFAQPGVRYSRGGRVDVVAMLEDDLSDALEDDILVGTNDTVAVIETKRVVAGLKEEVAMLVAAGKGVREIRKWLEGRQRMEIEYRAQLVNGDGSVEEKNERLREMGFAETK